MMQGKEDQPIRKELAEVSARLQEDPEDTELLYQHAGLLQQLGKYGDAINDLKHILEIRPDHPQALERMRYLETILKFTNMDIFSDTNTHHDPWLE